MKDNTATTKGTRKKLGPIELLAVEFPGSDFRGEIMNELEKLVDNDIIRVIGLLVIKKDEAGTVSAFGMSDLEDEDREVFSVLAVDDVGDILDEKDADRISKQLHDGASAALLLFENKWATDFADAVAHAHGQVLMNERIPRDQVDRILAEANG